MSNKDRLSYRGIEIKVDSNCPPGKIYFMNKDFIRFYGYIDTRTRWQRIKDRFKRFKDTFLSIFCNRCTYCGGQLQDYSDKFSICVDCKMRDDQ